MGGLLITLKDKIKSGLSSEDALKSLSNEGFNELSAEKSRTKLIILSEILKEPMFLLLLIAAILYLILGDLQEGLMLLGFVVVTLSFTFYQEGKTEKAIEALRDLTSPRALVIRDSKQLRIPSREIVIQDIILLNEGDRIPADGKVMSSTDFLVNESLLTGESIPVDKNISDNEVPLVYAGTLVVAGHAIIQITATGVKSEIGRIGDSLNIIKAEKSTLSKQTSVLVRQITILSIVISFLLVLIYGLIYQNWLQAVLAGIALAMAMLPQEYVVVMTLFPALGAWRLSKQNVLTRRLPSIETLGAVSVLCVDKTGTLTENKMSVTAMYNQKLESLKLDNSHVLELPESFHSLIELSILASAENPFDPMEKAFHELGNKFLVNTEHLHHDWKLVQEYGLTQELRAMAHVWKSTKGQSYAVAAKGSPEAIIELCHLEKLDKNLIEEKVNLMASSGLRVLGVAEAIYKGENFPDSEHDFEFHFIGLLGIADPLRSEIVSSVEDCHAAGIKIIMITGDYALTAKKIAEEAGLTVDLVLTGDLISEMSDEELQQKMKTINVCARISPQQKLRIVEALKANGQITAMTGDGVNDAPALKAAHVGIAMGERGTDVAREAASLILLDDNFSSIVKAIKLGRRIFDNIQKSMTYILAIHIPIAGMALLPILFKLPAMIFPMHIAFLELVIDPACSLAFENEPEEENIMNRPPRDTNALLMSGRVLTTALLQGFGALILVFAVYYFGIQKMSEADARASAFVVMVISNLSLIFSNRSRHMKLLTSFKLKNNTLWTVAIVTCLFLIAVLYIPFLQEVFRFSSLTFFQFSLSIVIGLLSIIWFELVKFFTA